MFYNKYVCVKLTERHISFWKFWYDLFSCKFFFSVVHNPVMVAFLIKLCLSGNHYMHNIKCSISPHAFKLNFQKFEMQKCWTQRYFVAYSDSWTCSFHHYHSHIKIKTVANSNKKCNCFQTLFLTTEQTSRFAPTQAFSFTIASS